jgi:hypothetical protein
MFYEQLPALDTYTILVEVRYDVPVNQTVSMIYTSGNQTQTTPMTETWQLPNNSTGFNLTLTITTLLFPQIPTAAENAAAMMGMLQAQLNNNTATYEMVSAAQTTNNDFTVLIGSFAAVGVVVLGVWLFRTKVKMEQLARRPH